MTDPKTVAAVRKELRSKLPGAIHHALASYATFAHLDDGAADPEAARDFAQHHAACKAALAHLECLIRLARWAVEDLKPKTAQTRSEQQALREMMSEARAALAELAPPDVDDG